MSEISAESARFNTSQILFDQAKMIYNKDCVSDFDILEIS